MYLVEGVVSIEHFYFEMLGGDFFSKLRRGSKENINIILILLILAKAVLFQLTPIIFVQSLRLWLRRWSRMAVISLWGWWFDPYHGWANILNQSVWEFVCKWEENVLIVLFVKVEKPQHKCSYFHCDAKPVLQQFLSLCFEKCGWNHIEFVILFYWKMDIQPFTTWWVKINHCVC